jgi:NDP-sugar pyrophosphorylase family protein
VIESHRRERREVSSLKAVILAAGKGTRMREITDSVPKPMVPVAGRPILSHVIEGLAAAGVSDVAIIVGYMGDAIRRHFGDGASVGVRIRYFTQEVQDGTGRAADVARGFLTDGPFFLSFGDILTDPSVYQGMVSAFAREPTDLLMAVRRVPDPGRFGVVRTDGDRIVDIVEKPPRGEEPSDLVNAGILVALPVLFEYTARLERSPRGEYELPDAVRAMVADGRDVRWYRIDHAWRDVGTPEDLARADSEA